MKTDTYYQLQCYCPPTRNFEPLLGCDYDTEEQAYSVLKTMLKEGRATGVRLVEARPGQRTAYRVLCVGPLPQCYFDDQLEDKEMGI